MSDVTEKTMLRLTAAVESAAESLMRMAVASETVAAAMETANPKPQPEILTVPWVSQLGPDAAFAPGDCGPACATMWLRYYKIDVTVDAVSAQTNLPRGYRYTMPAHIMKAMRHYGVNTYWRRKLTLADIYAEIDAGAPMIALVEYDWLPSDVRYDPAYASGHWITVVGYADAEPQRQIIYHDPYNIDTRGAYIAIDASEFDLAWIKNTESGNSPRQLIRLVR